MTRTAILVSPHFAPSTLAGVHRARHLAKWLPAHGWRPVVVRVDERHYAERLDPSLNALLPPDLIQVRTEAAARTAGIGDLGLRAYRPLRAATVQAILDHQADLVFMTGFPFYQMLMAGHLRRAHGLPVVVDFQDPWVSPFGASRPPFSKEGLAHRLATWLEPRILRNASFVTGVSETQNEDMRRRYPWLSPEIMAAIPIGGDPEDFRAVVGVAVDPDVIELRYIGAFWPRAEPCVRQLMRGLRRLRDRHPQVAERLRLAFTGTYSGGLPTAQPPRPVQAIAEQEGVGDLVRETPQRAPFVEALGLMAQAQGQLLVGSDEPHYTASKIYPALMAGRPFLSLFHARSSAHQILAQASGGLALGFEDLDQLAGMTDQIAEGLRRLAVEPNSLGAIDPGVYAPYTAEAVAGRYAAIFDRLTGAGGPR